MLSLLGRRVVGVARLSQRHAPSSGRRVSPLASSAAAASPDGSMDSSALLEGMKAKITTQLEAQSVDIQDAYGDAQHVTIDVVSAAFEGKNKVVVRDAAPRRDVAITEPRDPSHVVSGVKTDLMFERMRREHHDL